MIYEYSCQCGNEFERILPAAEYKTPQWCHCGLQGERVISRPMLVTVKRDICYDSPIDGRPITSWKQRQEDLARNGCQEYDPEMRKDTDRRLAREDAELDAKIEQTVEAEIEKMPSRKKEALANELLGGASASPERISAPAKSILTPINLPPV